MATSNIAMALRHARLRAFPNMILSILHRGLYLFLAPFVAVHTMSMPGDTCDRLSSHVQKQQYERNIVQKHNSAFEVKKMPLILRAVLCAMAN